MATTALSPIFSYLGWSFIPGYATIALQSLYYSLTISAGRPRPQPGQQIYVYHHRRIRIFVLSLYLVYTLLQALYDIKLAGDFYSALAVNPSSTDREIKARFRRLAARFHPDKLPQQGGDGTDTPSAAFMSLKLAQDTLLDGPKRFAYDRFGPRIVSLEHPNLRSIRDYVYAGLRSLVPEYAVGAASMIVLNYVWLPRWGQYYRYLAICTLLFLELFFLTHNTWHPPTVLVSMGAGLQGLVPHLLPPHLLPFQILAVARRMSISLNIFISQLAPPESRSQADEDRQTQAQIAHLQQATQRMDAEAGGLLNIGLTPYKGDVEHVTMLRRGMKEGIIMSAVRNSPEVREAVKGVVERRKRAQVLTTE